VVHTPFSFNTPVLADFVLRHLEENLKKENYMLSQLDKESGVMQIRKDDLAFALTVDHCDLVFESNPDEVPFIKALMFETIVSLHLELEHLKNIAKPDEIRGELLGASGEFAPENGHHHQLMLDKGLSRHSIIMELTANDKYGVIRELTAILAKNGLIDDAAAVAQEVMTRENVASTCIQNGIALPHARTNAVKRQVIAVGIRREGYEFDSLDGKPSRIFVLCLSPRDSNGPHIECLAKIASILSTPDKIQKIINARSPGEVYDIFRR
jgi:mannitol/fructose-specific phosphotransferase system IIA component (Ntr-type)